MGDTESPAGGAVGGGSAEEPPVLRAVEALADSQLAWFQNSGPFRHVCRAAIAQRKARGSWSLGESEGTTREIETVLGEDGEVKP